MRAYASLWLMVTASCALNKIALSGFAVMRHHSLECAIARFAG